MKVVILCVCSVAIGFVAGRNRQSPAPFAVATTPTPSFSPRIAMQKGQQKPGATNFVFDFEGIKAVPSRRFFSRLTDLARSVPLCEAASVLEAARRSLPDAEFSMFSDQLFTRWAEVDPASLLAYGDALPKDAKGRDNAISTALAEWAYIAPNEAIQYVEALPRRYRANLLQTILPGIAKTDPQRALSLVASFPVSERFSAKSQILNTLAESDPKAALDFYERHHGNPLFGRDERLLAGAFRAWISKDPNAAAAWFAGQPKAFQIRHAEEAARAFQSVAEINPATAAMLIAQLPNSADNTFPLGSTITAWCREDAAACKTWLDQQTDPALKNAGLAAYAERLADTDSSAAVELLLSITDLSNSEGYVNSIFFALAEKDPQAALAYSERISDESAKASAIAGVVSGWALSEPRAAAEYALNIEENENGMWSVHETIANYVMAEPAAALDWLKTIPADSVARNSAIQRALQEFSNASPEIAAQFAAILPAEEFAQQLTNFGQHWAHADPEEAVALASSLPEEASRAAALAGALGFWAQSAPAQAAAYLQNLSGQELSECTGAVVESMSRHDALGTAQWVQNFPEPLFSEALAKFLDNWIASDRRRAETWINSLPNENARATALAFLPALEN